MLMDMTHMDTDMAHGHRLSLRIIKKTLDGIHAILSCFLMYKIKIGPGVDMEAALASASEMNYKIIY